jgi:hypothetical protein
MHSFTICIALLVQDGQVSPAFERDMMLLCLMNDADDSRVGVCVDQTKQGFKYACTGR